jgi:hypothetical protein
MVEYRLGNYFPTRQTSTSIIPVAIQQKVVLLIFSQDKMPRGYLVGISLMSILFLPYFDVLMLKN